MLLETVVTLQQEGPKEMAVGHTGSVAVLTGNLEEHVHLAVELRLVLYQS